MAKEMHGAPIVGKFEKVPLEEWMESTEDIFRGNTDGAKEAWKNIKLPTRATYGSAGYDFYLPYDIIFKPNKAEIISTGIRCKIKSGWMLVMVPKSGLGFKHRLKMDNTVGIIDTDYYDADNYGHIKEKITKESDEELWLNAGMKFCQGIFIPYGVAVEEEEVTAERHGGFGSTGD